MSSPAPDLAALLAHGRELCRNGRLADGVEVFRKLIAADPEHALAHNFLGMALDRLGHPVDALASFDRAIAGDPNFSEALANKADALSSLGRFSESIDFYDRALSAAPDPAAWHNRGIALHALERYEDSILSFDRAIALDPHSDAAFAGRTRSLKALGRTQEALESAERAVAMRSNSPEHHSDRGLVLKSLGKNAEARAAFEQALALDPNCIPALANLAGLLIEKEDFEAALSLLRRGLAVQETDELKDLFLAYLSSLPTLERAVEISDLLLRAIEEPWSRPRAFAMAAVAALIFDRPVGLTVARAVAAWPRLLPAAELYGPPGITAIAKNRLLRALLKSTPVPNGSLEQFLTMARTALLETALVARSQTAAMSLPPPDVLEFYCALARQCFVNEYVFTVSSEELMRVRILEGELDRALSSGSAVPSVWLAAIASYSSLGSLPAGPVLLGRSWPDPVKALLHQQVAEPREEQRLRASIPRLTEIESGVSETVRQQYEENPYPRWVRAARVPPPRRIDARLREMFPLAQIRERDSARAVDILVAGCGTGMQSIEEARLYNGAQVLAIDLSLASLAYAKRHTIALGIDNIEYAQADILGLASLGRTFDSITCTGVLHHLGDPLEGWRRLLPLLRPRGYMQLGLYSEAARQPIVNAQNYLAARNFRSTLPDIRRARQEIFALPDGLPEKEVTGIADFYSSSECRDLLLHVQEHRLSLPQISAFLADHDLEFLGFMLPAGVLRRYDQRFPEDRSRTNLELWHQFESENPYVFVNMYQFWVQKR
jgi:tetratricopeptide (TPR) repeat protein/2-polyprenyl-3-methyl-5-hydroxy-6-metoxy-1,4-benzoquinol methylase